MADVINHQFPLGVRVIDAPFVCDLPTPPPATPAPDLTRRALEKALTICLVSFAVIATVSVMALVRDDLIGAPMMWPGACVHLAQLAGALIAMGLVSKVSAR